MPDQVIPRSLKVAVGVGNLGSSQVWAYLKLMLHLHATLSLIHCHSGSQRPFSAFAQASCSLAPSFRASSFDELNNAAKNLCLEKVQMFGAKSDQLYCTLL